MGSVGVRRPLVIGGPVWLIEVPQALPIVPGTAVVLAPRRDRSRGETYDERRLVAMVDIPRAGIEDPPIAGVLPRAFSDDRQSMRRNPVCEVKGGRCLCSCARRGFLWSRD